jgi:hypothetical protein
MSSAEDQACSDALAAIRRWLALRLARLEASPSAACGTLSVERELGVDPNLQTVLALTRVYEEGLRIASLQRANAWRLLKRTGQDGSGPAQSYTGTRLSGTPADDLEETLRRVSPECDARSYSM